ncbi:hypothetical protein TcasGA2_TC031339 [Tribolium castaneum]|uniref:Major facilitator superfamily (MFS) profile domain-containing protein n=1 Tax=Tribolium castaneum TaxID=7070 RepID=A0A139WB39_TRICA|nr:hypothetical protein TcasGA2_TC031339 [Tribolium castaneum]
MNLHHFATIFAAIVVPSLICGIYEAWTSAYVPKLEIENSFTNSDGSWITISLCVGGLTGALISFPLFDKWGRKKSLLTTTIPFMVSPLLLAFGNSVAIFCAARFFAGMGIGGCLAIIPQFVGEIAHETVRGALGTCIYVLQVFGMLFINVIGSYLSIKTSSFILFGIGVVYLLLFIFVVESPYFLIMKGENEGARKALRIFRNGGDVDSEFKRISQAVAEQIDNKGQFSDLFKIKTNRRALLIVFISVNAKQLTGDFTLDTYSQTIFNQLCDIPPMMFAVIFYSTKLIVVFISSFFIDKIGRRPTFLISLFGSGVIFLIIAAYLHIALHTDVVISDFVKKIMIFVMVLFTIFYSFLVAVPVLLLGELFPMNVKAFVSMLYVIHFFVASFVATKLFQVITDCEYLGMDVAFFAYSLSCFIHFLLVFKFVFETKGKTLEAIQEDLREQGRAPPMEEWQMQFLIVGVAEQCTGACRRRNTIAQAWGTQTPEFASPGACPLLRRSSAIPHKGGSSIPLPGSALPSRRCPPDKVRPVAGSSRASSPALSMIPRGPPAQISSPYQTPPQKNSNSMLDKLKLFKSNDRPAPTTNGKRTSSSSGVSSARSERSDSSASLEPSADVKPVKNAARLKQTRPTKTTPTKNSPNALKKDVLKKTATEVEKHAQKVANLASSKLVEPKIKAKTEIKSGQGQNHLPTQNQHGTGIPKPTAAIKGTTKIVRDDKSFPTLKTPISRENSQASITHTKPAVALVSPMKNEKEPQLSESSHSASTGHHSNSSESSVIYKPSSESSSEHHNIIPNRKDPIAYISEATEDQTDKEKLLNCENQEPKNFFNEKLNFMREGSQGDDETALSIEPMRPLLRGYCSTLTLPPRQRHYQRVQQDPSSDYCEISLANGYLSDGEMLRNAPSRDNSDGYMSEGGSVLYARRLQTMPAHIPNGVHAPPHRFHIVDARQTWSLGLTEILLSKVTLAGTKVGGFLCSKVIKKGNCDAISIGGDKDEDKAGKRCTPRISPGLTVLTEQSSRRGRVEEPPPPPAPRAASRSSRNGVALQDTKHGQWKRYTDSPGVGSPPPPAPAPSSPTSSRRERRSSPHGSKEKSSKVRGVPQSFGYVKRSSSTSNGTNGTPNGTTPQVLQNQTGKTASVSAVPRTKVKVSGGTQTCSSDLQQSHKSNAPQFKSYSLTGNAASQLSQSVRERLMMGSQSLPKGAGQDYGLVLRQGRPKASDGSLSDTQAIENTSPYAPWLRHSNTYSVAPRLSETDSMESLTSLPGHRSSLTHTRLLRDSPSRLSRSNSIRSTKSEKLYPSMLHRNTEPETEPYYCLPIGALSHWSQPTSPAPGNARTFPLSPTHSSTPRHSIPKNDDVHGSSISLVSTASSLYSSAEEKQAHEIRKLRRELTEAQEKVQTLTSQLSTNVSLKPFATQAFN